MSYVLRLHKTGNPNLKAWESSGKLTKEDIRTIEDTINAGMASKLGSSIPTPFARMYLFEAAFQIVADGHLVGNSMYHHLVSDCLDLFQFIFLNAKNPNLKFVKWNKRDRLKAMKDSVVVEHNKLADTLKLFFDSQRFSNTKEIYLIYYKNKIVGGTSPITGVYVSPNWKRIMKEMGEEFNTPIGDILFDDIPAAIHERDEDFLIYMYKYVYAHSHIIAKNSEAFYNYFHNAKNTYTKVGDLLEELGVDNDYTLQNFEEDYDAINVNPDNDESTEILYTGDCSIRRPKDEDIDAVIQQSDFLIAATKDYYLKYKDPNFPHKKMRQPLVLIAGNHKLNYTTSMWDETNTVPDIPESSLLGRKLPELSYEYPYLTTGDFLEDTLIELPYFLNEQAFFTGIQGKWKFLFPIKKEYFNYFTMKDLQNQLTILQNDSAVQVSLKIPVRNNNTIEFRKTYSLNDENDILKYPPGRGFNVGVFPFYKVTDIEELNKYSIGLTYNIDKPNLNFFKFNSIVNNETVSYESNVRTKGRSARDISSCFYDINEKSFDVLEVGIGEVVQVKGLIIPKFKEVYSTENNTQFSFAVDFGTSNTHVVYDSSLQRESIKPFDITDGERQMILLSEISEKTEGSLQKKILNGAGGLAESIDVYDREYVPSFIGEESVNNFPMRTSICEHVSYVDGGASLFANINIGFGLELDPGLHDNEYHTNIKWMIKSNRVGKSKERVELFFFELLWLIKNKIFLNTGSLQSEVIWMVPLSMGRKVRATFKQIWEEQTKKIFGANHQLKLILKYESIVPYYSVDNLRRSTDVVNIDIGGGTADILFVSNVKEKYYSTSFRFAGNDIWGEGLKEQGFSKDNGFYLMMKDKIDSEEINLKAGDNLDSIYSAFVSVNTLDSADVCAFLFKYDQYFKFSDHIKNHAPLSTILIIHFAATLYHIAQILKTKMKEIPELISFTGKGSEYIKLLGETSDVKDIVVTLLEKFTGLKASKLTKVVLSNNPKELTAIGALMEKSNQGKYNISDKVEDIIHLGLEESIQTREKTDSLGEINPYGDFEVRDIDELEVYSMEHFNKFISHLKDKELLRLFKEFEVKFRYGDFDVLEFIEDHAPASFREMKMRTRDENLEDEDLEETMFFWHLKDVLYPLSQRLYKLK